MVLWLGLRQRTTWSPAYRPPQAAFMALGGAVLVVGADDEHRQGIKPRLYAEIFTHAAPPCYFWLSTGGTMATYCRSSSGVLV